MISDYLPYKFTPYKALLSLILSEKYLQTTAPYDRIGSEVRHFQVKLNVKDGGNTMKKKKLLALLLSTTMALTACGGTGNQGNVETKEAVTQELTQPQEDTDQGSTQPQETTEESQHTQQETVESGKNNQETQDVQQITTDMVQITDENYGDTITVEDGTTIFTYDYTFPVITIEGNQAATEAIARDIEKHKNELLGEVEKLESSAREFYYDMAEQDALDSFNAYDDYTSYTVLYNNGKILSVLFSNWSYLGGAHGSAIETTVNYNLKTGEVLTFDTFFEDKDAAVETIREQILKQCESPYYQGILFEEYEECINDIIKEDYWYLKKDGVHIISNQYMLAPYAEGIQDFVIPYAELPQIKQEYMNQPVYLYPSIYGQTVEMDLDSDGTTESVSYNLIEGNNEIQIDENGEEYVVCGQTQCSIAINGEDYTNVLTKQEDYWLESPGQYYYLVDLDKNDKYIEIAVVDYGASDDSSTYFLRYDNKEVTYLGVITGSVDGGLCEFFGDGIIKSEIYSNILETSRLEGTFQLKDGKIKEVKQEWYSKNINRKNSHEILKEVTVYTENNTESETKVLTNADGPVNFVATDNEQWVQLETQDGSIYYLHMTGFTEIESGDTIEEATEIFANLMLAG